MATDTTDTTNTIPRTATRGQKRIEWARMRGGGRWNVGGGLAAARARSATTPSDRRSPATPTDPTLMPAQLGKGRQRLSRCSTAQEPGSAARRSTIRIRAGSTAIPRATRQSLLPRSRPSTTNRSLQDDPLMGAQCVSQLPPCGHFGTGSTADPSQSSCNFREECIAIGRAYRIPLTAHIWVPNAATFRIRGMLPSMAASLWTKVQGRAQAVGFSLRHLSRYLAPR